MSKYNWRTHEWKVGDRCSLRLMHSDAYKGTVTKVSQSLLVKPDCNSYQAYSYHRAECIPLRKKPRAPLREFYLNKIVVNRQSLWTINTLPEKTTGTDDETILVREVRKPKEPK